MPRLSKRHTAIGMAALGTLVTAAFFLFSGPIPQPLSYHDFADTRTLLGIPNGADVLSSLPFLGVGLWGLWLLHGAPRTRRPLHDGDPRFPAWGWFFAAIALTGPGSIWYHLAPDNARLVWDRLPMALAFMALTCAVLGEHLWKSLPRFLLYPLMLAGAATVLHWHHTEQAGAGDLRAYLVVQFLPLLLLPLVLATRPSRFTRAGDPWVALGIYGLAKVAEMLDEPIFQLLGISGHTLKHLLSALAVWWLLRMLRLRQPVRV